MPRRAALAALAGFAAGAQGMPEAREVFFAHIARAYDLPPAAIALAPQNDEAARLRVGAFRAFAVRLVLDRQDALVRGFAARGGTAAFMRMRDVAGRSLGLGPVLDALGMADPAGAAALPQIVARVLWAWRGPGNAAEHPDHPWTLRREGRAAVLRFLMLEASRTGSLVAHGVRVALEDGAARIGREVLPWRGPVPLRVAIAPAPLP